MARPERNNVDYFPFYCEDGKKMFYLEETYGNDGFATFVKILRELAKTDYHYLDLSKTTTMMFLSAKCKISKEVLESIIKDLVDLEKFDRVLWDENKIIWCQDFIDSIQDAYNKRKNKCITYDSLLLLLCGLGVRKQGKGTSKGDIKPQRKEKDIKENKNIEEEIEKIYSKFISEVLNGQHEITIKQWYSTLKINKGSLTHLLKDFKTQLLTDGKVHDSTVKLRSHFYSWLTKLDSLGKLNQHKINKTL